MTRPYITHEAMADSIARIPEDDRLTMRPIPPSRVIYYKFYELATKNYWTIGEVNLSEDCLHYEERLSDADRQFIDHVLAFFASADSLVNINLITRFLPSIQIPEIQAFYQFQIAVENIHSDMYSLLLETIVKDGSKRRHLLDSLKTMPVITQMGSFVQKWTMSAEPLAIRLLAMACVEGIFFAGCFCAIYWLGNRGLMPGLCTSNEWIARDERLHTEFAAALYYHGCTQKPTRDRIVAVVGEAVDAATDFVCSALSVDLAEMNSRLMSQYIRCVADQLLTLVEESPMYRLSNPFPFMNQINFKNHTNFFERTVSDYSKMSTSNDSGYCIDTEV